VTSNQNRRYKASAVEFFIVYLHSKTNILMSNIGPIKQQG